MTAPGGDRDGRRSSRGRLFVLSAPSGAGKTTLCDRLRDRFPALKYSVSSTTRPPRAGEIDGVDYHFISMETFESHTAAGRWAEWAKVHDHFYGTAVEHLERQLDGGHDLLMDIDVQGTRQILSRYPDCVTIFIMPPSWVVLRDRLVARGTDDPATIERRLNNAREEMANQDLYDHVIVNDRLDAAVDELASIITSDRRPG